MQGVASVTRAPFPPAHALTASFRLPCSRRRCSPQTLRFPPLEGYLDEQFHQLEELQDDVSPNFVEEVVTLFFRDSSRLIGTIEQALQKHPQDFHRLRTHVERLKGSSCSIGALKVKSECTLLGEYCDEGNMDRCLRSFQKVKREHAILRQKLEAYFQLLRQVGPTEKASGSGN
ncbi:Two-component phosphorelay intermediate involved in MAP kinase cascade regulation protein [Dioscorea alata]|uniref:Two-component phosphorelay intermediate involved in MAP kinase cascade regulation protein n=1 Tax=Dioscorea alata TaxID=55571 RepID=A0ACB7WE74_DIOAL|nr:Two-component phosphorelay intermediate involved in MAP kinase cascade regulation protein [Dioscorea alata]